MGASTFVPIAKHVEAVMNWKKIGRCIRAHVWGPVGSVVFHCGLLLLLIAWSRHPSDAVVLETLPVHMLPSPDKPLTMDPPIMRPLPARNFDRDNFAPASADDAVAWSGEIAGPQNESDTATMPGGDLDISFVKSVVAIDLGAVDFSGPLGDRIRQVNAATGGKSAGPAGQKTGAANPTEGSIRRALGWLRDHQNDDGSWGPDKIAMTGLALLTFLGHGETSGSKEYGMTVRKAIDFLADHQLETGLFSLSKQMSQPVVYQHAIATYAISEAYGMTRRPDLKDHMEKAATIIVSGQQPGGLWNYEYKKDARWDTSVSGWQIQALKAALVNGAEVAGLGGAIAKSAEGLRQAQAGDSGRFGYSQTGQGNISMTGVGALCLQLTGHAKQQDTRAGLFALREVECEWQRPEKWPMYTWYCVTQALYHDHGASWDSWSRKIIRELSRNQNPDGSWASPSGSAYENEETKHGPVYSTTLAVLSLEAPYRYAPVSQAIQQQQTKPRHHDNEVIVEVI